MKVKIVTVVAAVVLLAGMVSVAHGAVPKKGDWGLGFQVGLPASGVSADYWPGDKWRLQATLGPFGEVNSYGGKIVYKLIERENYYLYGALSAGSITLQNTYSYASGGEYEYENSISGGGLLLGVEWVGKHIAFSLEGGYGIFKLEASMDGVPLDLPEEYQSMGAPIFGIGLTWYL